MAGGAREGAHFAVGTFCGFPWEARWWEPQQVGLLAASAEFSRSSEVSLPGLFLSPPESSPSSVPPQDAALCRPTDAKGPPGEAVPRRPALVRPDITRPRDLHAETHHHGSEGLGGGPGRPVFPVFPFACGVSSSGSRQDLSMLACGTRDEEPQGE